MSSSRLESRKAQISAAIKTLKESSNLQEICKALSCIQSATSKSTTQDCPSEAQSKEICKLVVNAFTSGNKVLYPEASCTLVAILKSYKDRNLNLFNELMQVNLENRLKVFQLFEGLQDDTMKSVSRDPSMVNFLKDSLSSVAPEKMEWLSASACTENIKPLQIVEYKTLTPSEQVEERITICILELIHRLYKLSTSPSYTDCAKFSGFFMEKVAPLAYMGHKRQRAPAIKVLQLPNMGNHIRSNSLAVWQEYKSTLQNTYCQRMAVLVGACEPDWSILWTTSIQLLGTDLHRGAGLINNLLSVEEKAFKSVDTVVRRQAFLSWKLIVDNFALDEQELATARRVKLLCIPLNAKNSKTESMTLTKLEVWWHLIYKLYKHIDKFTNPVLTQFLNFCFGPLGDTPLLSSKFNVIASPGKRFTKTKLVAIDALLQLLSDNPDDLKLVTSSLEEKVPSPLSPEVFRECSKPFIHSIGEACVGLAQLGPRELETRVQIIAALWRILIARVRGVNDESAKIQMYKEIVALVVELSEHSENKNVIKEAMLEIILPTLDEFPSNYVFHYETMVGLMSVLTKPATLGKIMKKHHDLIKRLLCRGVKPPQVTASYVPNTLEVLKKLVMQLDSIKPDFDNLKGLSVLWSILSEIVTKYMLDGEDMNEGDAASHDFKTVQTLIKFPFSERFSPDFWQHKKVTIAWRALYKQFDLQTCLVPTVKPNEFVSFAISVIQDGIKMDRRCAGFAVTCVDGILTTMNYKHVLEENGFLPIVRLMNDLCIINLTDQRYKDAEAALRELSSVLITLYGHAPNKVASCLEAVRPAVEHMLRPCANPNLVKEIVSTWETIMSILRGLGGLLSPDVIVSFQSAIRLALRHQEAEIVSQTLSCLETEEYMKGPTKDLVETFLREVELEKSKKGTDAVVEVEGNAEKQIKTPKLTGSFLNRGTASPKTVMQTQKPRDETKSSLFTDSESQEYVVIKSDFKFDANRLTEHQKESLLRRREDIPALYNDLSQSCSQDTQNIQEWFNKKKIEISQAAAKDSTKCTTASAASMPPVLPSLSINPQIIDISDADKENKLDSEASKASSAPEDRTKTREGEEQQTDDKEKDAEGKNASKEKITENLSPNDILSSQNESEDNPELIKSVAKKLDFESRTEFPEDGIVVEKSCEVPSTSKNSEEKVEEKTKKIAKSNGGGESEMEQESIAQDSAKKEAKRGVKRKTLGDLDSDSDGNIVPSRRRRKTFTPTIGSEAQSDSDSVKSMENEETRQLSKRTKNEMSRLQINMVFDSKQFSTLPSRRRSKIHQEDEHDAVNDDHEIPETSKVTRQRTQRITPPESSKNRPKVVEKDAKSTVVPKVVKKRGRPRTLGQNDQPPEISPNRIGGSNSEIATSSASAAPNDQKTEKTKSVKDGPGSKDQEVNTEPLEEVVAENVDPLENDSQRSPLQGCNDSEEIVESSQASSPGSISLDKKYNNKQCFIRINKMKSIQPGESIELDMGKEKTKIIKGMKPDSPFKVQMAEISEAENSRKEIFIDKDDPLSEETAHSSSKTCDEPKEKKSEGVLPVSSEVEEDPVPLIVEPNSSSPESRPPATDASFSPIRLPTTALLSSSPKNSMKRNSKLKSVTTQGRAAHMLGLVTKQAIAETRPEIYIEEEISPVKKKVKEGEEETHGKKERLHVLREPERLGSPSGSRQEKIFNKMRTAPESEAAPTTSGLFGNLRNDGEKSSPGSNSERERNTCEHIANQNAQNDEGNTSPIQEREILPMLEWSSANPPSLTASPSASILKRQRQLQVENDPESPTSSKRKRVSFADPPVSKEMGYEIPASTPAHRMSKVSGSRVLLPRKDSPIRLKQSKLKPIQFSPGKPSKETETEVEMEKEKEKEKSVVNDTESQQTQTIGGEDIPEKITDDSDSPVIIFSESEDRSSSIIGDDKTNPRSHDSKVTIENLTMEVEIASGSQDPIPKNKDKDVAVAKAANAVTEKPKIDETETQRDIFETTELEDGFKPPEKRENPREKNSPDDNSLRCVDINVLTNSLARENNLARSQSSMETLEDTVDIQNVTGLNSTTNSDEIFSSRPIRTSTKSTEANTADTLPVTDSVFSGLPFSQNTQATNDTMELDQPELLDSTRSIYPSLTESCAPINSVIEYLVDPLWKLHLTNYLHSKGIETVGNLAQLTEREVNWIPVRGSPRVPFVRNVLQHFEKSIPSLPSTASTVDISQESATTTPNVSMSSLPPTSTPIAQSSSLPRSIGERNADNSMKESVGQSNKQTKSTETQVSIEQLLDEVDPTVVLKNAIRRCSAESILANYKQKMKNMAEEDLERETIKMLGIEIKNPIDTHLKTACRASGLSKVLGRLPDIFSHDKQFFAKVLTAYRYKIKIADCIRGLDIEDIKLAICQQCSSSDLAEMLSIKLKEEEESGVTTPMTELSSLQAMLKRMPKDLIISHTVANEELISPLVVLDIAIQNNNPADISAALESQPSSVKNRVFGDLCTVEAFATEIDKRKSDDETLTEMLKTISKKLDTPTLLDAFNAIMKEKFVTPKKEQPPPNT